MVGSRDRHEVDPVLTRGLGGEHFPVAAIASLGSHLVLIASGARALRIAAEYARHQLHTAAQLSAEMMDGTDEGTAAATDHGHFQSLLRSMHNRSPNDDTKSVYR